VGSGSVLGDAGLDVSRGPPLQARLLLMYRDFGKGKKGFENFTDILVFLCTALECLNPGTEKQWELVCWIGTAVPLERSFLKNKTRSALFPTESLSWRIAAISEGNKVNLRRNCIGGKSVIPYNGTQF